MDEYCVSHYDKKQLFAHMGEMGLTLDPKDFATNEYQVNEREHPRSAPRASGRKRKAIMPSEDKEEDEEQDDEDRAGAEASQAPNADTSVSFSDDDEGSPSEGNEPPLTGAHLTSPVADVKALVRRRNVIAPRTLFVEERVVDLVDPPSSSPAMETRLAKRAQQSRARSMPGPSSSTADDDIQTSRIHHLEERLDKMNQSQLEMQAQLQQTLADQAREQNKIMLKQQEINKQIVDSQTNFFKMTSESIQSILSSIPTMMRQYVIEAQAFNPAPLSAVAP